LPSFSTPRIPEGYMAHQSGATARMVGKWYRSRYPP